jgi:hypothetical protein
MTTVEIGWGSHPISIPSIYGSSPGTQPAKLTVPQRFVEVHGIVASHFRPRRHLFSAADYRKLRSKRFRVWNEVTRASALA